MADRTLRIRFQRGDVVVELDGDAASVHAELAGLLTSGYGHLPDFFEEAGTATGGGPTGPGAGAPVASILRPQDGETRPESTEIPFVGSGRDTDGAPLTGPALVWTSNIDGQIGTGDSFNARLSVGTNVITLVAKDSTGRTAHQSITLTITP